MSKNEIATTENAFAIADSELMQSLAEEMEGLTPTFDKIKIPSGGGLAFEIPGDDPDSPDMVKEFEAVILHQHSVNVYYKDKFDGSSNPPDCVSMDGKCGINAETGEVNECINCSRNKFGSAEDGKGKACKQKRKLYLLREGDLFPIVMMLPTGSIDDYQKFIRRTMVNYKKLHRVVIKFSLKKEKNKGGIFYSVAVFSVARQLSDEELKVIIPLCEQAKAYAESTELNAE